MRQYVLLYAGDAASDDDLERIKAAPGVRIIDQTIRRAMLLEGSSDAVAALSRELKGWLVAEEVTYGRPEPAPPDVK